MRNDPRNLMPGDRVLVFDWRLYKRDDITPLDFTMRPATIVRRYGQVALYSPITELADGPYPDLVDVQFDHRPGEISRGHFTDGVQELM